MYGRDRIPSVFQQYEWMCGRKRALKAAAGTTVGKRTATIERYQESVGGTTFYGRDMSFIKC